ncbi:MAG: SDR family oxidoreductase [Thalassovita sp.]
MTQTPLAGQVALVTGAGRGIGAAVATTLAAQGVKVGLVGRRLSSVTEVAQQIGENALAIEADVTNAQAIKDAVATTESHFGPIDLLINNAGISGTPGRIAEVDPKAWWRTQEINVLGVLLASQAVLPGMIERGRGRIVHMGSAAGNMPGPGVTDYSVSKTALLRLNESLSAEVADQGILSIAVSPGVVATDMLDHFDSVFRDTRAGWSGFDPDMIFPIEAITTLVSRIAQGDADQLGGRFVHVRDGLDAVLQNFERVVKDELLLLRINEL